MNAGVSAAEASTRDRTRPGPRARQRFGGAIVVARCYFASVQSCAVYAEGCRACACAASRSEAIREADSCECDAHKQRLRRLSAGCARFLRVAQRLWRPQRETRRGTCTWPPPITHGEEFP